MKAIILAAGFGTRLGEAASLTPKALLNVEGKPLLSHLLSSLQAIPLTEILIVTNQKFEPHFKSRLSEERNPSKIPLTLASNGVTETSSRLGTLGDLWQVMEKHELSEPLLVLLGDNFFSFDLTSFLRSVRTYPFDPWLGAYEVETKKEASRYGVITLDGGLRIKKFREKPPSPESLLISTGIYYFPSFFLWDELGLYRRIFPGKQDRMGDFLAWSSENFKLFAHLFREGFWFDIGDPESLRRAQSGGEKIGALHA